MHHLDLFSGIGGFALAAESVWPNINHTFVEYDPFCQAILKKHWPDSPVHGDIRAFVAHAESERARREKRNVRKEKRGPGSAHVQRPDGSNCFLLTGGFPCQPFSHAGRRKGTGDDRYLWPPMLACVALFRPEWVIAENVAGLASWNDGVVLETVCSDLEGAGYEVQPFVIPACAVGAPHRRDRIWIVAHADYVADTGCFGRTAGWPEKIQSQREKPKRTDSSSGSIGWRQDWPQVATELCTLDDGLSNGLVRPRGWRNAALKAAGNAIVPQVVAEIFRAIKSTEPVI